MVTPESSNEGSAPSNGVPKNNPDGGLLHCQRPGCHGILKHIGTKPVEKRDGLYAVEVYECQSPDCGWCFEGGRQRIDARDVDGTIKAAAVIG